MNNNKLPWWYPAIVTLKIGYAIYIVAFNFALITLIFLLITHPSFVLELIAGIIIGTVLAIYKFLSENPNGIQEIANAAKQQNNNK